MVWTSKYFRPSGGIFSATALLFFAFFSVFSSSARADDPVTYVWRGEAVSDGSALGGPWSGSGSAANPEHLQGRKEITTIDPETGEFTVEFFSIQSGDSAAFIGPDLFFRPVGGKRNVSLGGLPSGLDAVSFAMRDADFSGGSIDANAISISNPDENFFFAGLPNQMSFNGTNFKANTVSLSAGESLLNAPDPASVQVDPDTDLTFNGGQILADEKLTIKGYNHFLESQNPNGIANGEVTLNGTQVDSMKTLEVTSGGTAALPSEFSLKFDGAQSTVKSDVLLNMNANGKVNLEVGGGSELNWASESGVTQFGVFGDADVKIKGDSVVNTNSTIVALAENAKTIVEVDGAKWKLGETAAASSSIGGFGQAEVDVKNASEMTSGNLTIGLSNTAEGKTSSVTLHDTSKMTVNGFLEIGQSGQGELLVKDQSAVDVNGLVVMGNLKDSTGRAEIESGNGLKSTGTFEVGRNGDAELVVKEGGLVESGGDAFIGTFQSGFGKVTLDGSGAVFDAKGNVNIGNGSTSGPLDDKNGEGEFTIKDGGELKIAEGKEIRVGRREGSKGKLTLSGENAKITTEGAGPVTLNVGVAGEGELVLEQGYKLDAGKIDVKLGQDGTGKGKLTARDQGTEVIYQNATIGESGIGNFSIENEAAAKIEEKLVIGKSNKDTMSELTVSGQNSKLTVGQQIIVGEEGKGKLTIEKGGLVEIKDESFQRIVLGEKKGSEGILEIKGKDASVDFDVQKGSLVIGDEGKGNLKLTDGGLFILTSPGGSAIKLAAKEGSESNVEIAGREGDTRSRLGIDTDIYIGEKGTVQVRVQDGGLLQSRPGADIKTVVGGGEDTIAVDGPNKGNGTVTVTGKDSEWQVSGTFVIGNAAGTGKVNVEDGGTLKSLGKTQDLVIAGKNENALGELHLKGENTQMTYANEKFLIGEKGRGELTVESGAKLKSEGTNQKVSLSGDVFLQEERPASSANALGIATITGEGSEWAHHGTIAVGNEQEGFLTVEDKAKLILTGESRLEVHRGVLRVENGGVVEAPDLLMDKPDEGNRVFLSLKGEVGKEAKLITEKAEIGRFISVNVGPHSEWDLTGGTGGVADGGAGETALSIHGSLFDDAGDESISTRILAAGEGARINATGRDVSVDRAIFEIGENAFMKVNKLSVDGPQRTEFHVINGTDTLGLDAHEIVVGETGTADFTVSGAVKTDSLKVGVDNKDLPFPGSSRAEFNVFGGKTEVTGTTTIAVNAAQGSLTVNTGSFKTDKLVIAEQAAAEGSVSVLSKGVLQAGSVNVGSFFGGNGKLEAFSDGMVSIAKTLTIHKNGVVEPGNGGNSKGFITVGNVVDAILGAVVVGPGGILNGTGKIIGDLIVQGAAQSGFGTGGTVAPGHSPGTLTVDGDFILQQGGVLNLEFSGTGAGDFDQIFANGMIRINPGGVINLNFINGFLPEEGDLFPFLSSPSFFDIPGDVVFNVNGLASGFQFSTTVGSDGFLTLKALNNGHAPVVPEPSTLFLLMLGIAGYRFLQRRK